MSRLHNTLLTFGLAVLLPAFASAQSLTAPSTAAEGSLIDLVVSDPNRASSAVNVLVTYGNGNTEVLTCLLDQNGHAVIDGYPLPGAAGTTVTFSLEETGATTTTLVTAPSVPIHRVP